MSSPRRSFKKALLWVALAMAVVLIGWTVERNYERDTPLRLTEERIRGTVRAGMSSLEVERALGVPYKNLAADGPLAFSVYQNHEPSGATVIVVVVFRDDRMTNLQYLNADDSTVEIQSTTSQSSQPR